MEFRSVIGTFSLGISGINFILRTYSLSEPCAREVENTSLIAIGEGICCAHALPFHLSEPACETSFPEN